MTIELHEECQKRLLNILESQLPNFEVDSGRFLQSVSMSGLLAGDEALPSKVRRKMAGWISENPFSTFMVGYLTTKVMNEFGFKSGTREKLLDLPGYTDPKKVARGLLETFLSLPWHYGLFFSLPLTAHEESQADTRVYELNDGVSLLAPGIEFGSKYPVLLGEESPYRGFAAGPAGPGQWHADRYYVEIQAVGFIDDFVTTRPIEDASLLLRALGGLFLSSGAVTSREIYSPVPMESPFFVYLHEGERQILKQSHMLSSDYAEKIRTLEWVDVPEVRGKPWPKLMKQLADLLRPSLSPGEENNLIRRSGQWYFDSSCGTNALLQFVQATVAIEILLGDKATSDVVGIVELLANRCAYLLAESHDERGRILQEMKQAYNTRSSIVHRGQSRLSREESIQLAKLQRYCAAVIRKELKLLSKTLEAPE